MEQRRLDWNPEPEHIDQRDNVLLAEQNRTRFAARLQSSRPSVAAVAAYLFKETDFNILIQQPKMTPNYQSRMKYADQGDIELFKQHEDHRETHRVEVKQSSREFLCLDEFPFNMVTVCEVQSFERAEPKPAAWFIVNSTVNGAIIVRHKTYRDWQKWAYQTTNYKGNREEEVFRVQRGLLDFVRLR